MPAYRTVYDWQAARGAFSADIARAREAGFDQIAADCLLIADDNSGDADDLDVRLEEQPSGGALRRQSGTSSENVHRAKLRIDTRLKLLAKWDPKRYGDKVALTGGAEGDAPLKSELTVRFVRSAD